MSGHNAALGERVLRGVSALFSDAVLTSANLPGDFFALAPLRGPSAAASDIMSCDFVFVLCPRTWRKAEQDVELCVTARAVQDVSAVNAMRSVFLGGGARLRSSHPISPRST